jgi:dihydrofolate reductase
MMTRLRSEISTSLDGYVAGPNATVGSPLGEGGEALHQWMFGLATFRERHGMDGGERNADDEVVAESLENVGAVVMGRRMFSGGSGPWEDDPVADGWWGDDPPFRVPVFVVTHHARETVTKQGGTSFTFVTEGFERAYELARDAADGKDVSLAGGADMVQQALRAGLLDELNVHVAPILLGGGVRLFDNVAGTDVELEIVRVIDSRSVTHLKYRIAK